MRPRLAFLVLLVPLAVRGDGLRDNYPDKVRPIPPKGVEIPEKDRKELEGRVAELGKAIERLPEAIRPDVLVFHKAVDWALRYDEFFGLDDVAKARKLLDEGMKRAKHTGKGLPYWATQTGLVVRGFRSHIDGSVQPYGLVVPKGYDPDRDRPYRLDVWLHGRMEGKTELRFMEERMRSAGEFTPRGAFVLHPFGRYSNAFKLAGEVDVLEALAHVQKNYIIDEDRLVMRGFSMGGAGCWQMAAHYPGKWCAAAPGAGFSETPLFLRDFQKEKLSPTWYERKLWQMYDCPGYALNFHNLPVVAYSGEKDIQKQAADVMAEALKGEGIELVHIIGPGTGHGYHARSKGEINVCIDRLAEKGRERVPRRVRFTTYTLRYNECRWVQFDGLEEHWKQAKVDASITENGVAVRAENVTGLTLRFGPGESPFTDAGTASVTINGVKPEALPGLLPSDRSWACSFHRKGKGWVASAGDFFRKGHGRQGPIDDAFLNRFLIVRPTGEAMHERTGQWVKAEMGRAIREWRRQFRGDAVVKDDKDVTAEDIRTSNLILWGDPSSNLLIGRVLGKLPLKWDRKGLALAGKTHDVSTHVPALIHPNPLNRNLCVVLNSGFTYREYDYLNNARQHAKLPDWAVIDIRTPPGTQWPGKIADADFFDEHWKVKPRKE